jgi:hypothetical protein
MAGCDLDIPEVDASIEHGRHEGVAEHMRVGSANLDPRGAGELMQAAGRGVPVHPGAAAVEQDRAPRPGPGRPVDGPADGGRQRDQDNLGAFAADAQHPVAVLFAEVADIGAGGLEDPQAEQAEHGHQREVVRVR